MSDIEDQKKIMKEFAIASIINAALHADFDGVDRAAAVDRNAINFQEPQSGVTALHVAAGNGNLALTKHLLAKPGIDATIRDRFGRDALDLAMAINARDVIEEISGQLYPKSFAGSKPGTPEAAP